MKKIVIFTFILIITGFILMENTYADGMITPHENEDIRSPSQKAIIIYENNIEQLILQIKYDGKAKDFGWVVPTPSYPNIEIADAELFFALHEKTIPRIVNMPGYELLLILSNPRTFSNSKDNSGIEILKEEQVGIYNVTTLSASNPDTLTNWLKENKYKLPENVDSIIDHYVKNKWYFIAMKIDVENNKDVLALEREKLELEKEYKKYGIDINDIGLLYERKINDLIYEIINNNKYTQEKHGELKKELYEALSKDYHGWGHEKKEYLKNFIESNINKQYSFPTNNGVYYHSEDNVIICDLTKELLKCDSEKLADFKKDYEKFEKERKLFGEEEEVCSRSYGWYYGEIKRLSPKILNECASYKEYVDSYINKETDANNFVAEFDNYLQNIHIKRVCSAYGMNCLNTDEDVIKKLANLIYEDIETNKSYVDSYVFNISFVFSIPSKMPVSSEEFYSFLNSIYYGHHNEELLNSRIKEDKSLWYSLDHKKKRLMRVNKQINAKKEHIINSMNSGTIQPLNITFASTQILFPLKMTSLNKIDTEILLYILSNNRVEAKNFDLEYSGWCENCFDTRIELLKKRIQDQVKKEINNETGNNFKKEINKKWYLTKLRGTFSPEEMEDVIIKNAKNNGEYRMINKNNSFGKVYGTIHSFFYKLINVF